MASYKFVARDLMTEKVVCVYPETPVSDLIKILVDYQINGVPVVDKKERLIGVVSKTDIVAIEEKTGKKQKAGNKNSFYGDSNGRVKEDFDKISKTKDFGEIAVKDIMTSRVITADADDTIDRLAKIMFNKKIHRIVIQEDGHVIGVVSTLDILRAVSTMGYGSSAFITDEAILDLQEKLEAAEKSIQSLRNIIDKIHGEK